MPPMPVLPILLIPPIELPVKLDIPGDVDEPMLRWPNIPLVPCPQASNPYPYTAKNINTTAMDLNFIISTPAQLEI
jgi:hypothetical protein